MSQMNFEWRSVGCLKDKLNLPENKAVSKLLFDLKTQEGDVEGVISYLRNNLIDSVQTQDLNTSSPEKDYARFS